MLVLLVVGFGIDGREGVLAIVIGSGVAILPNAYFTFQCFRFDASKDPMKAISALFRGEVGKIILVIVFTALSFKYLDVQNPLLLFSALFVMLLTQSFASVALVQSMDQREDQKIDEHSDTLMKPNKRD